MDQATHDFLKTCSSVIIGRTLDVGSLNINGSAREDLHICIGIDIRPGPDVDIVLDGRYAAQQFGAQSFDSIICVNTIEHCEDWRGLLIGTWDALKMGGVMLMTAPFSKGYHGYPGDYWRFTNEHFREIFKYQHVIRMLEHDRWAGICARKMTNMLYLVVEPMMVPAKKQESTLTFRCAG